MFKQFVTLLIDYGRQMVSAMFKQFVTLLIDYGRQMVSRQSM